MVSQMLRVRPTNIAYFDAATLDCGHSVIPVRCTAEGLVEDCEDVRGTYPTLPEAKAVAGRMNVEQQGHILYVHHDDD